MDEISDGVRQADGRWELPRRRRLVLAQLAAYVLAIPMAMFVAAVTDRASSCRRLDTPAMMFLGMWIAFATGPAVSLALGDRTRAISVLVRHVIVVAVVLMVVMALPGTRMTRDREAQRLTMGRLEDFAGLIERSRADDGTLPPITSLEQVAADARYPQDAKDAWGAPIVLVVDGLNACLVSHGLCSEPELPLATLCDPTQAEQQTTCFRSDIVIVNGVFMRSPSGKQHDCR